MSTTTVVAPSPASSTPAGSSPAGAAPADPSRAGITAVAPAWITATVRPAGSFGRGDVGRLRALLDALSACASIVVLDLQAARLLSPRAATAIDEAAHRLEEQGGCLLCVNVDADSRACLSTAGPHAVLLARG